MDRLTKEQRSDTMRRIRAKNTSPEMIVRADLFKHGFRYRIADKRYPGHPDIVLPKYKTVVFVHGCFWHQHPNCRKATIPKSNQAFWIPKLQRNVERDREQTRKLEELGWRVLVVWECELDKNKRENTLRKLREEIVNGYADL